VRRALSTSAAMRLTVSNSVTSWRVGSMTTRNVSSRNAITSSTPKESMMPLEIRGSSTPSSPRRMAVRNRPTRKPAIVCCGVTGGSLTEGQLRFAIQRRPPLVIREKAHAADLLPFAEVEAVELAGGDHDHVSLGHLDADPFVAAVAHIEDAVAGDDEAHLVLGVEVLAVEL